ncbi:hypothetical protein [Pasteuria penetrans]|uniref:hypothetical protein n=1 Tax=Pasteuria penetrans TaxID=86005 RepID=UPI000FB0E90B|nr:hypothetical protein [Pasteuria penetrans]
MWQQQHSLTGFGFVVWQQQHSLTGFGFVVWQQHFLTGTRAQQLKTRATQTGRQQLLMEEKKHCRPW